MDHGHVLKLADNAPAATITAGAATVTFWGLHVADICVVLSTVATILGLLLQFYLAMHRIRRLERGQDAQRVVTKAVTKTVRETAAKVDSMENSGDKN